MKPVLISLALVGAIASPASYAASPEALLATLERTARSEQPAFAGFSADRGKKFFTQRHGGDWSCSTCHSSDPRSPGRHAVTAGPIEPLAPATNAVRLSNPAKVEKWFRRNCRDVLARECTAAEKGDVVAYLLSLRP